MRLFFWLIFTSLSASLNAQTISTFAGDGTYVDTIFHGIPATSTGLDAPYGLAIDSVGNIYFTDIGAFTINQVKPSGILTTIAGVGSPGYSIDGTPATNAKLMFPAAIALDHHGNLYVADGNIIRKISASGIIYTVAGGASVPCYCEGGPATAATFNVITGIAVDQWDNIYVSDYYSYVIRKISGGIITTLAGTPFVAGHSGDESLATAAQLNTTLSVAVDQAGNVYIGDFYYLRKVNTSGIITTIAGEGLYNYSGDGGPATSANFKGISGIALDAYGNIFLSDGGNERIRVINTSGVVNTYAGNGVEGYAGDGGLATFAEFYGIEGIAIDGSGCLYIADQDNHRVRKVSAPTATPLLNKSSTRMQVYPNPVIDNRISVNITEENNEEATIIITNTTGQKLYSGVCPTNTIVSFSIDFPPGMYFITATTKEFKINKKIVVE